MGVAFIPLTPATKFHNEGDSYYEADRTRAKRDGERKRPSKTKRIGEKKNEFIDKSRMVIELLAIHECFPSSTRRE